MIDLDVITTFLSSSVVTGAATYFFTRKQRDADVTSKKIENVSKALDVYNTALEDIRADNKEKSKQIYELNKQLSKVNLRVASLMRFSCVNMSCKQRLTDLSVLDFEDDKKNKDEKTE